MKLNHNNLRQKFLMNAKNMPFQFSFETPFSRGIKLLKFFK